MKFDTVDDGRERLDDLAQTEEAITARMENESRYTTTPTPAPTGDARWLSPETRSRTEVDNNLGPLPYSLTIQRLLNHATLMDERLQQAEAQIVQWRLLAFVNHACIAKYGDDGELQCGNCLIDFKRDSLEDIHKKLYQRGVLRLNAERDEIAAKYREIAELRGLVNTPETEDFDKAVPLEAAHQVMRWTTAHDAGKQPEDWFWLLGYLAGKALASLRSGNIEKAKHHCISSAAALRNWHAHIRSGSSAMRPGIAEPKSDSAMKEQA